MLFWVGRKVPAQALTKAPEPRRAIPMSEFKVDWDAIAAKGIPVTEEQLRERFPERFKEGA